MELQSITEATVSLPSPIHSTAVWRWARRGLKARNGATIRLRHVRVGGRLFIPVGALDEFFEAVAAADVEHFETPPAPPPLPVQTRSERARSRDIAAARATLARLGA